MNKHTNLERCTKQELIREIQNLRNKLSCFENKYTAKILFTVEGIEEEVYEIVQRAFEAAKHSCNSSQVFCDDFCWYADKGDEINE